MNTATLVIRGKGSLYFIQRNVLQSVKFAHHIMTVKQSFAALRSKQFAASL